MISAKRYQLYSGKPHYYFSGGKYYCKIGLYSYAGATCEEALANLKKWNRRLLDEVPKL